MIYFLVNSLMLCTTDEWVFYKENVNMKLIYDLYAFFDSIEIFMPSERKTSFVLSKFLHINFDRNAEDNFYIFV